MTAPDLVHDRTHIDWLAVRLSHPEQVGEEGEGGVAVVQTPRLPHVARPVWLAVPAQSGAPSRSERPR